MATTFKKLLSYSFLIANNPDLDIDVHATIQGDEFTVEILLPVQMTFESLIASFTYVGDSITVDGIPQVSNISENDFNNPVIYTIEAEDGTTQDYTIYVKHNNIQEIVPPIVDLKVKQIFDVFEESYREKTTDAIEIIQNIFNPDFEKDSEIVDMFLELVGFYIGDFSYFDAATTKKLKNLFWNNIFTIYRNKLKDIVFKQIFYIYGLRGNVYTLDTYDWDSFVRGTTEYVSAIELETDSGLETDTDYYTDNLFRTPFLEIEIMLDQEFSNGTLWFSNINSNIKSNFENIRHVLSKLYYTFKCVAVGVDSDTIENENGVSIYSDDIPGIEFVHDYRLTFDDDSQETYSIDEKSETSSEYVFNLRRTFTEDKIITRIELLASTGRRYVDISCPDLFLQAGDQLLFDIYVVDDVSGVGATYGYGYYSANYYS